MNNEFLDELRKIVKPEYILEKEPMERHTTFRVGGPADVLVTPSREELSAVVKLCKEQGVPYYIVGNGSNLLVGDKGIRGVVIAMTGRMGDIVCDGEIIRAGAGTSLALVASKAASESLTGMEFAAGIPGTIGGAVVMNAGAYGGEMKDILVRALVMDELGNEKELSAEQLDLGYRHSCISEEQLIVLEVTLKLKKGHIDDIRAKMAELREQRMAKQPLEYPSAGSTFKRPEGYFAGKLIMDAGLRGFSVGGAQVAEKHCGFVINKGNATAADISLLMKEVAAKVEEQFGVMLEPEVKMLGEF